MASAFSSPIAPIRRAVEARARISKQFLPALAAVGGAVEIDIQQTFGEAVRPAFEAV